VKYLIGIALIFGLGSCVGAKTVTPDVEFVKVPGRTKVVHKTSPPEIVEIMPKACISALEEADRLSYLASNFYAKSDRQLKILQQARMAVNGYRDVNEVSRMQRDLQGDAIANLSNLSKSMYRFETYKEDCDAAQEQ